MKEYFSFDERLGISLPILDVDWGFYSTEEQQSILLSWEQIRGTIPDRIIELEHTINRKQALLNEEDDFKKSCELNTEIADLASIINDLWIWYRANQTMTAKIHQ